MIFGLVRTVSRSLAQCELLHVSRQETGATSPVKGRLLANPEWIDVAAFRGLEVLTVAEGEPWGANTLAVNGTVLVADSSPRTADILESKGLKVQRLGISELQKAEAGLTCLSVCFRKLE